MLRLESYIFIIRERVIPSGPHVCPTPPPPLRFLTDEHTLILYTLLVLSTLHLQHSGNIQGTFKEHPGDIKGTFVEHSGNVQSENVKIHQTKGAVGYLLLYHGF